MSQFRPRSGKANDIKSRCKHFRYCRAVPPEFCQFFDGKTEWNIKLEGATEAVRRGEAGALAHQHNKMMTIDVVDTLRSRRLMALLCGSTGRQFSSKPRQTQSSAGGQPEMLR